MPKCWTVELEVILMKMVEVCECIIVWWLSGCIINVWVVWVDDDDELNVYEYDNVWITYLSKVKLMILIELYGFYVLDDALSWLKWLWKM